MQPPLFQLLMHGIDRQVIIIKCLDSQRRQLSHDALPLPTLFRALRQKKGHPQPKQDAFSLRLLMDAHKNGHEKCLPEVDISLQKGFISWKQNQLSASKIYASKNYGFSFIA